MKFKPSTLILLVLALGLGGAVYLWERQGSSQSREQAAGQPIFGFKEDQVQALTITTQHQTLSFVRAGAQEKGQNKWLIKAPKGPASDAAIAYLLNLLVTTKSDRTLTVLNSQRREFGLDQPLATVEVKLNNQETHQLVLGGPDFNHSVLYAQADPPKTAQELKVVLVPTAFENAVNRPLSEWRSNGSARPAPIDPN